MTDERNKQIVRQAFEAWMSGDLSPLGDLLAPDAKLHQCGFLDPIPGSAILNGEFPRGDRLRDRQVRLQRMISEGDMVALQWSTFGHYSDANSPELDGKPVSFPSMTFVRCEDTKIAEIWNIQDMSTLQTRLYELAEAAGGT